MSVRKKTSTKWPEMLDESHRQQTLYYAENKDFTIPSPTKKTKKKKKLFLRTTLLGTNISLQKGTFEDDFPFPQVGYVTSLEGIPSGKKKMLMI